VSGWADPGETIEAIERPDRSWALGVLWHTEEDRMSPVLAALTEAAAGVRA
jgi:gamma-glutamyl-gamma-aminobutyrate hydrolase PuuD